MAACGRQGQEAKPYGRSEPPKELVRFNDGGGFRNRVMPQHLGWAGEGEERGG